MRFIYQRLYFGEQSSFIALVKVNQIKRTPSIKQCSMQIWVTSFHPQPGGCVYVVTFDPTVIAPRNIPDYGMAVSVPSAASLVTATALPFSPGVTSSQGR